jgi:hypothetical protein
MPFFGYPFLFKARHLTMHGNAAAERSLGQPARIRKISGSNLVEVDERSVRNEDEPLRTHPSSWPYERPDNTRVQRRRSADDAEGNSI